MRKTLTLKYLNEKIAQPLGVELVKGPGYFYLVGDHLTGEESTSIYVYRISDLSFEQWKEQIEDLVAKAPIPSPPSKKEDSGIRRI